MKAYKNLVIAASILFSLEVAVADTGVLVLAHGPQHGQGHGGHACHLMDPPPWEKNVLEVVKDAQSQFRLPTQVSFGMWETECIDHAIAMLQGQMAPRSLDHLIVVPFFISSYSSVIEMQKYIFGLRPDRPLPIPVERSTFTGKVTYSAAIDYSPQVSAILQDRAKELAGLAKPKDPGKQELYIIMHGPVENIANHKWLEMGHRYAAELTLLGFLDIKVISLRDDIDEPMRSEITEELRATITSTVARGREALILPYLLSDEGIQGRILERLKGLKFIWTGKALAPDLRLSKIILDRVNKSVLEAGSTKSINRID